MNGMGLPRRIALPLVAIVIYAYGVAGFVAFGYSPLDAVYMTSMALTTVGFTTPEDFSSAEKLFTVSISLLGVTTFLAFIALFVQALAEGQLGAESRRRRAMKKIDNMSDHYVICAYGRVGRAVAREFEGEGVAYVVVDPKEELEDQMRSDGARYLIADPSKESVLRAAGIERAKGLVCAVDSDSTNVYITLTARAINANLFIVARASEPGSAELLTRAGANRVVSPYVTSGRHMALVAVRPRVIESISVGAAEDQVRLDELLVEPGSSLVGKTIDSAKGDAHVLVLKRANGELIPRPSEKEKLGEGDLLLLLGETRALRSIEER